MKAAKKEKENTVLKRPKCDFIPEKKRKKKEKFLSLIFLLRCL